MEFVSYKKSTMEDPMLGSWLKAGKDPKHVHGTNLAARALTWGNIPAGIPASAA